MQNIYSKRPFGLYIESIEAPEPELFFPNPKKKVKKALSIEILDSFRDDHPNFHGKSYSLCQNSPMQKKVGSNLFPPMSPRNSTSSAIIFSPRLQSQHSLAFGMEEERSLQIPQNHKYDDFYVEGDFYDVTMRKCHRKVMEDRTVIDPELHTNKSNDKFFAIYDGHTSSYVSDFLEENFHKRMSAHSCFNEEPKKAFRETFQQIDKEIIQKLESRNIQGGSTALCALIREEKFYLANAGDSKAVLIRKNEIKEMNKEHRASNEEERMRVEELGGVIIVNKSRSLVQGSLQITRSLGDRKYKKYISCEPDIYEHEITNEDQMIIMASDGFWDVMNNDEIMDIIKANGYQTPSLSKVLTDAATKKRAYGLDNISLIVIYLPSLTKKI